ncbi:hypothetical protein RU86_GL001701 [Lactococcus piscium]|uniref:Uncharacterized protein n=1 Tax=Pseudolactococcus piscium TaxID=1364 RepID=A0A2A5S3J3_9LACT|nr:hypothetical protein RU86_GL001701 [Lactococcus piscium]
MTPISTEYKQDPSEATSSEGFFFSKQTKNQALTTRFQNFIF